MKLILKTKKHSKAFTLTEMIVVIAIIGILAAVLIPSITIYIKNAKVSKGVQEARNITTVLAAEAAFQDRDYFEPYEISRIIEDFDYSLKSPLKNYRFWYDASENQVIFIPLEEAFSSEVKLAGGGFTQNCIEALSSAHPEYRYVDEYEDELSELIYTVRNLPTLARQELGLVDDKLLDDNKLSVINEMDQLLNHSIENLNDFKQKGVDVKSIINFAKVFNTSDTVYVDDNYMYNKAYFTESSEIEDLASTEDNMTYHNEKLSLEISQMVFVPGIKKVPAVESVAFNFEVTITNSFEIPDTVTTVVANSFKNVVFCVGIVAKDTVIIDPEALSDAAEAAKSDRHSNVTFVTLYEGADFEITYQSAEAKLNNGKIVSYKEGSPIPLENITFQEKITTVENGEENTVVKVIDEEKIISKYLIPHIEFKKNRIDFGKIEQLVIRRSLGENICTYSAVIVDSDLNCYKVENFGYITDIDWEIEQEFSVDNDEAIVRIFLPTYVYNYSNFKNASMEIILLPQVLMEKEIESMQGIMKVHDGIALGSKPITIRIEDGIYDSSIDKYVYESKLENLQDDPDKTVMINKIAYACNQVTLAKISVYSKEDEQLNYLFIRNYQNLDLDIE